MRYRCTICHFVLGSVICLDCTANVQSNCYSSAVYLEVLVTQGAAAEAQKDLKDALLVAQFIAVCIANASLQHTQDPLTLHLVLQRTLDRTVILPRQLTPPSQKTNIGLKMPELSKQTDKG